MRTLAVMIALLAATTPSRSAEINAFVSTAIKAVTDELLPPFERANGYTIRATFAPSGALLPRFERGEPVDVFLTDSTALDALIRQGKIVGGRTDLARTGIGIAVRKGAPRPDVASPEALRRALLPRFARGEPADVFLTDSAAIDALIRQGKVVGGRTDLARTGIGIAVRKGARKPDVSSVQALKRALIAAKTVGYAAPSGGSITAAHIIGVFERLGIAAEMAPKARLAAGGPNGRVSVLVSSGEAEIGLQQVSELMSNPGVEVIGMLPPELQQTTIYSAGVTTSAREADAARALIGALTAPSAAPVYKARGLEPAW